MKTVVWKRLFPGWDPAPGSRLPALDGFRALGVAAVMMGHGIPKDSVLAPLRLLGLPAVYVFFAISGFLITDRLLEEEARKGQVDVQGFYLRRALRILPAAYAFLGVVWIFGAVGWFQLMPPWEIIADTFFLQDYVGIFPGRTLYTGHFWTLAIEEKFYLLFPLLFILCGPRRRGRVLFLLCLIVPLWRLLDGYIVQLQNFFPGMFPMYRLDWVFDVLLWGCLSAVLVREERIRLFLRRALSPTVWICLAALSVVVMWKQPPLFISVGGMLATLLVLGTVLRPESWVARMFELRPLRIVGQLSYGMYLWQQLFFVGSVHAPQWPQLFPLNVVFTLALALLSFHCIEQPFINVWARLKARRRAQPVTMGAAN